MSKYEKVLYSSVYEKCDFCDNTTEQDGIWIQVCVVCGKDVCNDHEHIELGRNLCSDAILCPECDTTHYFDILSGHLYVRQLNDGKPIWNPHLDQVLKKRKL